MDPTLLESISSCRIQPPSLETWIVMASLHAGLTVMCGVPLAVGAVFYHDRPIVCRCLALALGLGTPLVLHTWWYNQEWSNPHEHHDDHDDDDSSNNSTTKSYWMAGFVVNSFCFNAVVRLWNVAQGQVPHAVAHADLRTFIEWFLLVPQVYLDDLGQTRKVTLGQVQARWHCFLYKIIAASVLLSILLPFRHDAYRVPLSALVPDDQAWGVTRGTLAWTLVQETLNGWLHIWWMYVFLSFCLDFSILANTVTTGGKAMEEGFCNPLLESRTFREAWGTRWNLPVQRLLQRTVYVPLRQDAGYSRVGAALRTFVASGMLHEYNFWTHNYTAYRNPGVVTVFFVAMGGLMLSEGWIWENACPWPLRNVIRRLPSPLIATTLTLLVAIPAEHCFIPTWLEAGMMESVSRLFPYVTCA